MLKSEAKERIEKLKKEINYHRYLYHVLDRQEISDAALDSLKNELAKLEDAYPEFLTPDSPTRRIGGQPLSKFKKVQYTTRMTSLNDAFSEEELKEWEKRILKLAGSPTSRGKSDFQYFAEAKGDGFAVSLIYENGVFKTGSTRGDGIVGEDVTENLKTIESIPLLVSEDFLEESKKHKEILLTTPGVARILATPGVLHRKLEIRGEVYMSKSAFAEVNRKQKKKGFPVFANPRNIAAGSVRQLDSKITASRKLDFFAWDLVTDLGQETHEEEHLIMKVLGFPTVPFTRRCKNIKEVIDFCKEVGEKREKLPFLIDGIVVQVNSGKIFEKLGIVGKAPRGAIAFKFPAEEATTIIEDIIVQVGRTGVLTPVATLKPVRIGGVAVTHATLHNMDEIKRLDVRIGDTVIVERAGDVIPAVTGVLKRLRPKSASGFNMPKKCPVCGSPVRRVESSGKKQGWSVAYYCSNKNCSAIQREKLYHFVSKKAFDIQGLGPKIIDALGESGLIENAADIFMLKKEDIEPLERFAEKSSSNLIAAIDKKRTIELSRFILALGIHHVGEETARLLSQQITNYKLRITNPADLLDVFQKSITLEKLQQIEDIGPIVAQSIYDWFRYKKNQKLLGKFNKAGLKIKSLAFVKIPAGRQKLTGKIFVLTGELKSLTRDEAKEKIREFGGDTSEGVSKKTDFVVVGEKPGSKYEKAKELGIKILNEKEFLHIIKF